MRKFVEVYCPNVAIEAYDDVGMTEQLGVLDGQTGGLDPVFSAIENALEHYQYAVKIKNILISHEEFTPKAYSLARIAIEGIVKQTGIEYAMHGIRMVPTMENIRAFKALSLESISDVIKTILNSIKKAFDYIWDLIVKFFTWLTSSSKKKETENLIRDTREVSKTANVREKTPLFPNIALLRNLDYGVKIIGNNQIEELIIRQNTFLKNIESLVTEFEDATGKMMHHYDLFRDTADKIARKSIEGNKEIFDFKVFREAIYQSFAQTIDKKILANYQKTDVRKEQNLYEGIIEKSNGSSAKQHDIQFGEPGNIVDMRTSETLGNLAKILFVMYNGEYENYEAVIAIQAELSLIEEGSSRYLNSKEFDKISGDILEHTDINIRTIEKIQSIFKNSRATIIKIIDHLHNYNEIDRARVMEESTAASYTATINLILIYLQRYSKFSLEVFAKGVALSSKTEQAISNYVVEHQKYFNSIISEKA